MSHKLQFFYFNFNYRYAFHCRRFIADVFLSILRSTSFHFKIFSRRSSSTVSNYCGKKLPIRKHVRTIASIEDYHITQQY